MSQRDARRLTIILIAPMVLLGLTAACHDVSDEGQLRWLNTEASRLSDLETVIRYKRIQYEKLKAQWRHREPESDEQARRWNEHITRERDTVQEFIDDYNERARKYRERAEAFDLELYSDALGYPPKHIGSLPDMP